MTQREAQAETAADAPWPLNESGVWVQTRGTPAPQPRAGLLLDRDGVIVNQVAYLSDPADVRLMPGAAELIGGLNRRKLPVAVVTNQSGIDRGNFGWADFAAVERRIGDLLAEEDCVVDGVAACPFHPDATPGFGPAHARWRKPGSAMIEEMVERLNIDAAASWLVGDKAADMEAARNAGLAGAVHVLCGHGEAEREAALALGREDFQVIAVDDIRAAAAAIGALFPEHAE